MSIAGNTRLRLDYRCSPGHLPDCGHPWGAADLDAQWMAEELVAYQEVLGGRPVLVRAPDVNAYPRVKALFAESMATDYDPQGCGRYVSTEPTANDPNLKDGWLSIGQPFTFVQPGHFFHLSPGSSIAGVFATCVKGFGPEGQSGATSAWDGLNQPWQWTIKNWTRNQWRHANALQRVISETIPQFTIVRGDTVVHDASSNMVVLLNYFPAKDLAAQGKQLNNQYPITSQGMRELPWPR